MGNAYAGDITVARAVEFLSADKNSVLLDVRTETEWQNTGVADLQQTQKETQLISWKVCPNFEVNHQFLHQFNNLQISPETKIAVLCKAGGRSREAAIALAAAEYNNVYNIIGGMEDEGGWIKSGLPIKGYTK